MKKIPFIVLLILSLIGCDKDSTEIESDDKVRLSLSAINFIFDSKDDTGKKDFDLTIKLYKDSVNQQTGKTESNHISVSSTGILTLEVDEKSYDLFDYYQQGTVLYGEGSYRITLPDIENNIESLTVKLLLNEQTYRADSLVPTPLLVTNYAYWAENYEPLEDDILIDWEPTVLPTKIEGIQTVYFKDQQYCTKDKYTFDVPTDIFSHYIYKEDMNHGCENITQEIRDIKTEVSLVQSDSDLPYASAGFDSVSIYFENNYHWLEVTVF